MIIKDKEPLALAPEINTKIVKNGLSLNLFYLIKKKLKKIHKIHESLIYPKEVWSFYPEKKKQKLKRNLSYLLTLPLPLLANFKKIDYNIAEPEFKKKFQKLMLRDLPTSTFEYKQDFEKIKKQYLSLNISFNKGDKNKIQKNNNKNQRNIKLKSKSNQFKQNNKQNNKYKQSKTNKIDDADNIDTIISFSMGKDSLLSLAISKEINLKPLALYINDTVSPTENKIKIRTLRKISNKIKIKTAVVTNSVEKLNDFETWDREEMSLNYAHMVTSFCFISLPFIHFYNAKNLIIGNEKNMDFYLKLRNKKLYPSYDQSSEWTKEQEKMLNNFENKENKFENVNVFSVIRPLTNIAIIKILYSRYPDFAVFQNSCYGLDALGNSRNSTKKRWCLNCSACKDTSLFLTAFGINPKIVGLEKMFDKKYKKNYALFKKRKEVKEVYDILVSRDQELLALLFALRNGSKGYIIELFKKHYLKEALSREDELRKKYFKLYQSRIPKEYKSKILSIYKEELKDLI